MEHIHSHYYGVKRINYTYADVKNKNKKIYTMLSSLQNDLCTWPLCVVEKYRDWSMQKKIK